jgi:TolB-like protein
VRTSQICLLAAAFLVPATALATAVIHVRCSDACKIKIDGKRGEKISDTEYKWEGLAAGIYEVETSRGFASGWADVPADGTVEIQVSKENVVVNGVLALDKKAKKKLEEERKDQLDKAKKDADKLKKDEEKAKKDEERAKKDQEKADRDAKDKEKKDKEKAQASMKTKIAVARLTSRTGLDQATADLFTDALVGELRKRQGLAVTDRNDIAAVLGAEKEKALLGCSNDSCLAEIGGALGVEQLVSGTVGRVGKSLIVNLTLIDSKKAQAISTVSERLKSSSDEAFFDALPDLVDQLVKKKR